LTRFNFKGLFEKHADSGGCVAIGDVLPFAQQSGLLADKGRVYCFVSTACGTCLDILPALIDEARHHPGKVYIASTGDPDTTERISAYHQFPIQVITREQRSENKIFTTPIAYLVDVDGIVVQSVVLHSISDIEPLLSACVSQ